MCVWLFQQTLSFYLDVTMGETLPRRWIYQLEKECSIWFTNQSQSWEWIYLCVRLHYISAPKLPLVFCKSKAAAQVSHGHCTVTTVKPKSIIILSAVPPSQRSNIYSAFTALFKPVGPFAVANIELNSQFGEDQWPL